MVDEITEWNEITKWGKSVCGTLNMIANYDIKAKELELNNLAFIHIHLGKEHVCQHEHIDAIADTISLALSVSAHKEATLNKIIDLYKNKRCSEETTIGKCCYRIIAKLLEKFFIKEVK